MNYASFLSLVEISISRHKKCPKKSVADSVAPLRHVNVTFTRSLRKTIPLFNTISSDFFSKINLTSNYLSSFLKILLEILTWSKFSLTKNPSKKFRLYLVTVKFKISVLGWHVSWQRCNGIHLAVKRQGMPFTVMDRCRKEVAGKLAEKTSWMVRARIEQGRVCGFWILLDN